MAKEWFLEFKRDGIADENMISYEFVGWFC